MPHLIGEAQTFWWSGQLFNGSQAVETCLRQHDGVDYFFYQCALPGGGNGVGVIPFNSTTVGQSLPQNTHIIPTVARFFNIFSDKRGTWFMNCGISDAGGSTYLYANDGNPSAQTWAQVNGGQPILTQQSTGPLQLIYNVSIVPVGDVWFALIESDGGMYFSWCDAPHVATGPISLNDNFNSTLAIPNGGSPELHLSADGSHFVCLHHISGERFGDYAGFVTISTAPVSTSPVWTTYKDTFAIGEKNEIIADATLLDSWSGPTIYVSYKQLRPRQLSRTTPFSQLVGALLGR